MVSVAPNVLPPVEVQALSSAARTATTSSNTVPNKSGHKALMAILDCTVWASNFTVSINVVSPTGGHSAALLTSANITGTGVTVLTIDPSVATAANKTLSQRAPSQASVTVTASDASSNTYSVDLVWLP